MSHFEVFTNFIVKNASIAVSTKYGIIIMKVSKIGVSMAFFISGKTKIVMVAIRTNDVPIKAYAVYFLKKEKIV